MLPHWSVEFYGHRSPCFSAPNMWMMTQNCRKPHQPRVIFPGHVRSPLVSQLVQLFKWEKLRKNIFGTWYRPWWLPSGNWTVRVFQMAIVKSLIYPWRNVIFHRFLLVYQRVIDFPNPLFFWHFGQAAAGGPFLTHAGAGAWSVTALDSCRWPFLQHVDMLVTYHLNILKCGCEL